MAIVSIPVKPTITDEELALIKLVGLPNKIIGIRLGTSPFVIGNRIQKLCEKLRVENRTGLAIMALTTGLVTVYELIYRVSVGDEIRGRKNLS